jgi:hypothetical protein
VPIISSYVKQVSVFCLSFFTGKKLGRGIDSEKNNGNTRPQRVHSRKANRPRHLKDIPPDFIWLKDMKCWGKFLGFRYGKDCWNYIFSPRD